MSFKAIDSFLETLAEAPIVKKINAIGGILDIEEEEPEEQSEKELAEESLAYRTK